MRTAQRHVLFVPGLLLLATACNDHRASTVAASAHPATPVETPSEPSAVPTAAPIPFDPPSGGVAAASGTSGTVRETMNAAGYTYMRVDTQDGSRWVATTEMPVAVGSVVEVSGGNEMPGFHSRTLNRTFEQITFASSVRVVGGTPAPSSAPAAAQAAAEPSAAPAAPQEPAGDTSHGTVRETMNSGGYTYLRIDSPAGSRWVAVPETTVTVGSQIEVVGANEMPGFHSRTLNRTFDQLTFASSVRVIGGGGAPTAAPSTLPPGHPGIAPAGNAPNGTDPTALPPGHPPIGPTV